MAPGSPSQLGLCLEQDGVAGISCLGRHLTSGTCTVSAGLVSLWHRATWGLPEKRKDLLERKPLQGRQSQGQLPGPKTEAQKEGRDFESLILGLRFAFFFFFFLMILLRIREYSLSFPTVHHASPSVLSTAQLSSTPDSTLFSYSISPLPRVILTLFTTNQGPKLTIPV